MASGGAASSTASGPDASALAAGEQPSPVKRRWWERIPHTYVILFVMMVLAAIMTYIIPAGAYDRVEVEGLSKPAIDPNSFHAVDAAHTSFFGLFTAIPDGMVGAASIIFLILLSTAAFTVINETGALSGGIAVLLSKIEHANVPKVLVIWIVTFLFSGLGVIVGPEIQIPFTIFGITIALGLGYDLIVGLAMILGGGYVGFAFGPINASILGTAQSVVGLPIFSGQGLRWLLWLAATIVMAIMTSLYARKITRNPSKSLVKDVDPKGLDLTAGARGVKLTGRHYLTLVVLLLMFAAIIVGASKFSWYLTEMSAVFVIGGLAAGYASGLSTRQIIDAEVRGVSQAAPIAIMLGLARATQVILENGNIMDTIIHALSGLVGDQNSVVAAILISIITAIIHFFIPSGSGLAVAVMPILGPLGHLSGLSQQATVLAFQIGATVPNWIYPTVGATMAMIGIARVPFDRWLRFGLKLVGVMFLLSWIFLGIAVVIGY